MPQADMRLEMGWLTRVLDAIRDGVLVVDASSCIMYANPSYTRCFGVPVERVLGRKLSDIEPTSRVLDVLRTGVSIVDGPERIVSLGVDIVANISPVIEDGRITGAVAVFRDVTEVMALQEKLREALQEMEKTRDLSTRYYSELQELRARFLDIDDLVLESPQMKKTLELVFRLSPVDSTVLLTGESGVGKEIVAKLIHRTSRRSDGPFVVLNCGAIPETLLESELFGYEKGAFTGASKEGKIGLLEVANKGTMFLDEIGELPLSLQVKLLRVIQEHKYLRIGGLQPVEVDVRFVAASNRDLRSMVREKTFREDLFYRLNVVPIHVPPLRERVKDIAPLTRHFLRKYNSKYSLDKRILPEVIRYFETYPWPGNVRELENVVERLVVSSRRQTIGLDDETLREYFQEVKAGGSPVLITDIVSLEEAKCLVEKQLLSRAYEMCGSIRKAARLLGADHSTLARKARKLGLTLGPKGDAG